MRTILNSIIAFCLLLGLICGYAALKNRHQEDDAPEVKTVTNDETPGNSQDPQLDIVAQTSKPINFSKQMEVIKLTTKNTVAIRDEVTSESMSKLEVDLLEKSAQLKPNETIYLVMNTPGGSIIAGNNFIDTARGIPQKIKTITLISASMGFHIVESLDERLITPTGILMSHQAAGSFEGSFGSDGKGQVISRLNWMIRMTRQMDQVAANRMGMKLQDYQNLIHDEYWTVGPDAVKDHAADRVVLARCSRELLEQTVTEHIEVLIASADITYSGCPLITAPISMKLNMGAKASVDDKADFTKFMTELTTDKEAFTKDYIVTGKYQKYIKE